MSLGRLKKRMGKEKKRRVKGAVAWDFDGVLSIPGSGITDASLIVLTMDVLDQCGVVSIIGSQRAVYASAKDINVEEIRREVKGLRQAYDKEKSGEGKKAIQTQVEDLEGRIGEVEKKQEMMQALESSFGPTESRKHLKIEDAVACYGAWDSEASTAAGGQKNFILQKVGEYFGLPETAVCLIDDNPIYGVAIRDAHRKNPFVSVGRSQKYGAYKDRVHLARLLATMVPMDKLMAAIDKCGANDSALANELKVIFILRQAKDILPNVIQNYVDTHPDIHSANKKYLIENAKVFFEQDHHNAEKLRGLKVLMEGEYFAIYKDLRKLCLQALGFKSIKAFKVVIDRLIVSHDLREKIADNFKEKLAVNVGNVVALLDESRRKLPELHTDRAYLSHFIGALEGADNDSKRLLILNKILQHEHFVSGKGRDDLIQLVEMLAGEPLQAGKDAVSVAAYAVKQIELMAADLVQNAEYRGSHVVEEVLEAQRFIGELDSRVSALIAEATPLSEMQARPRPRAKGGRPPARVKKTDQIEGPEPQDEVIRAPGLKPGKLGE